jgi:hypothetical protein
MVSVPRILAVTGGLILAGILAGALAAGCGWVIAALLSGNWRLALDPKIWRFSALVGGFIGAVAAPLTSWLFLRHVPLGRLIFQTTIVTAVIGGVSFALNLNPFLLASVGFVGAAVRLALVTPARRAADRLPQADPPGKLGA